MQQLTYYNQQLKMRKGIVRGINPIFGTGIIEDENEQEITFCLSQQLDESIGIDDHVEFDIVMSPHGLIANNVKMFSYLMNA